MNPELRASGGIEDWVTIVIMLSLFVFVLGKYFHQSRFMNFLVLPFNNKYIFLYSKKGKRMSWFNLFISLFQLLNLSLFLFFAFTILTKGPFENAFLMFLAILAIIMSFHLLKIILQFAKAYVFNTKKLVAELIFNKLSYFNHSSIFIFIANILLAYVFQGSKSVVFITILMILTINGIGIFNILKNHQKLILANVFYFILYLCALEIAPLVILGSYLKD